VASPSGFCLFAHSVDRAQKAAAGVLGSASAKRRREVMRQLTEANALSVGLPLRTMKQIQRFLAQEAAVFRATGDASRSNAASRMAATAVTTLPWDALKAENAELRRLLLERHPELAGHLRKPVR
jgi:hypothetical protein